MAALSGQGGRGILPPLLPGVGITGVHSGLVLNSCPHAYMASN